MMLGKEVKISMPEQAMESFRQRAQADSAAIIAGIDKAIDRISIEHASATFESDRSAVFGNIDGSVGRRALDQFAKEIMRTALMKAAFPAGLPAELAAADRQSHGQWAQICAEILVEANKPDTPISKRIQSQRAVALMRLREDGNSTVGLQELEAVAKLALRYYGVRGEEVRDIERELEACRRRR